MSKINIRGISTNLKAGTNYRVNGARKAGAFADALRQNQDPSKEMVKKLQDNKMKEELYAAFKRGI